MMQHLHKLDTRIEISFILMSKVGNFPQKEVALYCEPILKPLYNIP